MTQANPPISIEPDRDGWRLAFGSGPDLVDAGAQTGANGMIEGRNRTVRITISCRGGTRADVEVRQGDQKVLETFTTSCSATVPESTVVDVVLPDGSVFVEATPDARMWLAITVQEKASASPAP